MVQHKLLPFFSLPSPQFFYYSPAIVSPVPLPLMVRTHLLITTTTIIAASTTNHDTQNLYIHPTLFPTLQIYLSLHVPPHFRSQFILMYSCFI